MSFVYRLFPALSNLLIWSEKNNVLCIQVISSSVKPAYVVVKQCPLYTGYFQLKQTCLYGRKTMSFLDGLFPAQTNLLRWSENTVLCRQVISSSKKPAYVIEKQCPLYTDYFQLSQTRLCGSKTISFVDRLFPAQSNPLIWSKEMSFVYRLFPAQSNPLIWSKEMSFVYRLFPAQSNPLNWLPISANSSAATF